MLEFKFRKSVKIFEDDTEITLAVGFLENNIVTVSKKEVSVEFIDIIRALAKGEKIETEIDNEYTSELMKLYNMGFLKIRQMNSNQKILIINFNDTRHASINDIENVQHISFCTLINENEANILISKTDSLAYNAVYKKISSALKDYTTVMILGSLSHYNKLLVLNSLLTKSCIPAIFFTYDLVSTYVVGVNSEAGTACFECFVTNLMNSKNLSGSKYQSNALELDYAMLSFLESIMHSELKNLHIYEGSTIYGNAITYMSGIYQFTFNFNRRTVMCNNCIEDFYDSFEEQNVAAINLIKNIER